MFFNSITKKHGFKSYINIDFNNKNNIDFELKGSESGGVFILHGQKDLTYVLGFA